jgi:hypothetical protein
MRAYYQVWLLSTAKLDLLSLPTHLLSEVLRLLSPRHLRGEKLMDATLNQSKIKRSATSDPLLLNRTENGLQIGLQK